MKKDNEYQMMVATHKPLEKTLYNRLTEKYSFKLDSLATSEPVAARDIREFLKAEKFWSHLYAYQLVELRYRLGIDMNDIDEAFQS